MRAIVWRTERHLPPVEAQDEVPASRLLDIVCRDQDGPPLVGEPIHQCHQPLHASLVHAGERLVQQHHPRVLNERTRNQDALPLAARELAEPRVSHLREPHVPERTERLRPFVASDSPPPRHTRQRSHQRHIEGADRIVEPRSLGLGHVAARLPHLDRPAQRAKLTQQEAKQRRLTPAVRAQHPDCLPRVEGEAHVCDHGHGAVAGCHPSGLDHRLGRLYRGIEHSRRPSVRPRAIVSAFVASISR